MCENFAVNGISKNFPYNIGTCQGCEMSQSLFTQFPFEYLKMLEQEDVYVSKDLTNLLAFIYAVDIGNVTDTVKRLQNIKLLIKH